MGKFSQDRRSFLQGVGLVAGATFIDPGVILPFEENLDPDKIGIIQGPTNSERAVFTVVAHKKFNLNYLIEGPTAAQVSVSKYDPNHNDFVVYNILVHGLAPNYTYKIKTVNSNGQVLSQRTFSALDWSRSDRMKLAILSCSDQRKSESSSVMSSRLLAAKPDVILCLGDLVYANSSSDTVFGRAAKPKDAYHRFVLSIQKFAFYDSEKLIPMFCGWDDHDTGQNNATSSHPYLAEMSRMFRAFFPMESGWPSLDVGPGMSFSLKIFGSQFLVFDQRTFSDRTQFIGAAQLQWAQNAILSNRGPLVLCGGQLFLHYHSWGTSFEADASQEMNALLQATKTAGRPCVFLSGDIHYSQIQEIGPQYLGYKTYEITSSAFFSSSAGQFGKRSPQDGQIEYFGGSNFIVFDQMKFSERSMSMQVTCVSENSMNQFSKQVQVSI